MDFVLTTAGLQALINVSETGTNAVELTHIGIGSGNTRRRRRRRRCRVRSRLFESSKVVRQEITRFTSLHVMPTL